MTAGMGVCWIDGSRPSAKPNHKIAEGVKVRAIKIYRIGRFFYERNLRGLSRFFDLLNYLLHNSSIPSSCRLGRETRFGHSGIGAVVNPRAQVGEHCLIGQGATIGGRGGKTAGVIEDNVYIGPGARILGNVRIGHDSIIGANAVVVKDVEPYSVMAGVPAKRIARITKESFEEKYKYYHGPRGWAEDGAESQIPMDQGEQAESHD
jgi:serine O-acetyltransferase